MLSVLEAEHLECSPQFAFTWRVGRCHWNWLSQGWKQPQHLDWSQTDPDYTRRGWYSRTSAVRNLLCTAWQPHLEWERTVNDAWCMLCNVNCCWTWCRWYWIRSRECHLFSQLKSIDEYSIPCCYHASFTTNLGGAWYHRTCSSDCSMKGFLFWLLLPVSGFEVCWVISVGLAVGLWDETVVLFLSDFCGCILVFFLTNSWGFLCYFPSWVLVVVGFFFGGWWWCVACESEENRERRILASLHSQAQVGILLVGKFYWGPVVNFSHLIYSEANG